MFRLGKSSAELAVLGSVAVLTTMLSVPALPAQVQLKPVGQPMEHKFQPENLQFSPDGKRLLVGPGVAWLWDVSTQKIVGDGIMGPHKTTGADRPKNAPLDGDKYRLVVAANFAPDKKSLIVLSDAFLQRWDAATAKPLARAISLLPAASQKAATVEGPVAFSRDGKVALAQYRVLNAKGECAGLLINTSTGRTVGAPLNYGQHVKVKNRSQLRATACAFSDDGKKVTTLHGNHDGHVWDATTGKHVGPELLLLGKGQRHFSPNGKSLATVNYNGLEVWDLGTGKVTASAKRWASATEVQVAFSPDSRTLAMFGADAKGFFDIQILTLPMLKVQATIRQERIRKLLFSPDGKTLLTMAEDSPMKLWEATTGKLRATVEGEGAYQTAAFSPDGTLLATSFGTARPDRAQVQLWRLHGGEK